MENKLITKPFFDGDISAKIKTLGEITSNIEDVKNFALSLKDYFLKVNYDEDTLQSAKDEKAKINKFKNEIASYRKEIVSQFNEPIKKFESLAKETESILTDTYGAINNQVVSYENVQKDAKRQEVEDYFNEYKGIMNVDFLNFDNANINVTLSASMKSLKEKAKEYIDKVAKDVETIKTLDDVEEIMVEYKTNLDLNKSIMSIKNRHQMIQIEKEIQERQRQESAEMEEHLKNFVQEQNEEQKLDLPVEEAVQEEVFTATFTVRGTRKQLMALKNYIDENNILRL